MKSLLPSWGKLLLICVCNRKKSLVPDSNVVAAFQTHFLHRMTVVHGGAVVATHYQYHVGRLWGVFDMKVCTALPARGKMRRTLLQAPKGKSSVIISCHCPR